MDVCSDVNGYLNEARKFLKEKNIVGFIENVSFAKYLAKDDEELLVEVLIEQSDGLYKLAEYEHTYEMIEDLLNNRTVKDVKTRLELLRKKGIMLCKFGVFEEAINIFNQLIEEEHVKFKIMGLGNLAWAYMVLYQKNKDKSNITKAREYCKQALVLLETYNDTKLYKEILNNHGNTFWYSNEFEEALEVFLEIYKLDNNDLNALNSIATTFVSLGEGANAKIYLDQAEKLALKEDNNYAMANITLIHGRIADQIYEDTLKAKDYYLVAFDQFSKTNAFLEMCTCLDNMLDLDAKINKESINILRERLQDGLSKGFQKKLINL